MAPNARAYVQDLFRADSDLQRETALRGALISNNSWGFGGDNDYDIFAASYDAAVRDSLPGVTGEQEVAYVFASGNEGGGSEDGLGGIPGSVISPATGKNVITVGGVICRGTSRMKFFAARARMGRTRCARPIFPGAG